ncbi:hypothetical protein HYH03_003462 [Edaphochlamys debaryana]|uniref:Sugar phosphate transporter domain-containing protein n=1 Tax=Edaphochlamys debaryana TaxID=47281 RepID=A0A835Y9D6_9CHLO|nr:hypothetical protein HYH03_003462 [Edaphochlamys debaryana]|eukprot:KAG2498722.1 hypothetical protein HYH03_003462 [Edaphochlamys debaryana]
MTSAEQQKDEEQQALLSTMGDVEGQKASATNVDSASDKPVKVDKRKPIFMGMGLATLAISYYALCSSTMLVINKVAIHQLPCPTSVLCVQLLTATLFVAVGNHAGLVSAEAVEWAKLRKFIWVVVGFLGTIFANIKVLQHANVETFITFRSSTPLVLSLCDYFFLGRMLPSLRSWLSLVVLLAGSVGYVMVDADYKIDAYYWLLLWYAFFTFDTVYVKHMCDTVKMTNWARVYYTNLIALIPLAFAVPLLGEHKVLATTAWTGSVVTPLVLSCVVGVCMSHSSYLLRETVSATLFTIVGILCKIITVVINVLIWDKHATPSGIAFLLVCVGAGTFYEQSPRRPT